MFKANSRNNHNFTNYLSIKSKLERSMVVLASRFLDDIQFFMQQMKKLFPKDQVFYATDTTTFICKLTSNFDVPFVQVGVPFAKGGPADKVIQTGQVVMNELDASYYGVALKVFSAPIFDYY